MNWLSTSLRRLLSSQFSHYVIVSGIALCVDYGSYWLLATGTDLALPVAASIGYGIGLIVAYFLIAGRVFEDGWLRNKRVLEVTLFLLSGLLGVFLTYGTVAMYINLFGEHLHGPKLLAISISFIGVYIFRKYVVFRQSTAGTS